MLNPSLRKLYVFVMLLAIFSNEKLNPEPIVFCGHKNISCDMRIVFKKKKKQVFNKEDFLSDSVLEK